MTIVMQSNLAEALEHCRKVTRSQARNFYYGLKLTPGLKRSALYAIYAWMRKADDLVDRPGVDESTMLRNVECFYDATAAALADAPSDDDPVWISLHHVGRRYGLDKELFRSMIDGQLDDLRIKRYETFTQLREYCYRVASTVGLICITIWGYEDESAPTLAVDRGLAFQLTNIIRDFREDHEMGRTYLPAEDFRKHGLTPDELRGWSEPERCRNFILEQIDRAETFYESSKPLDACIDSSCVPALWAMTTIYRGTLEKIRQNPEKIVTGSRIALRPFHKSAIALQAKWRSMRARNGAS